MRFEGEIIRTPCIDMLAYYRARREQKLRIVLMSEFEIDRCFNVYAGVIGKFNNDFCDGADPLTIKEDGEGEVTAHIQLSSGLVNRLKKDNETPEPILEIIRRELGQLD